LAQSEDTVIEDDVLAANIVPEDNFRKFMAWVKGVLSEDAR